MEKPEPRPNEALVKVEAVGVNFMDVYNRTGAYPVPLPFTPGAEAAGTVEAIGSEVSDIAVGDRVAYAGVVGSYAEYAVVPAARLVKMPEGIRAGDVLNLIATGELKLRIEKTYPLGEAAEAHRQLEGRATTGKILLLP